MQELASCGSDVNAPMCTPKKQQLMDELTTEIMQQLTDGANSLIPQLVLDLDVGRVKFQRFLECSNRCSVLL